MSNETPNINVFFDNLQVTHLEGPLLEESHYYPFGTEMSAISSHSLPSYVPNRYKANAGAEYGDEEWSPDSYRDGLEMYETFYRSYNAQIGRFMQGDPMMEATVSMSGYVFSGNNPVMFTDLLGDQYKYMDKMGNRWHHADIMEGTAIEGQQYVEGYGLDGFGDSWIGDVKNGGGGGGKGHGSSQTDYTSQWEEIVAGFNSGKGDSWSPGYGFYDGSLYPDGVNWVKLREVVVKGYLPKDRLHKDFTIDNLSQAFSHYFNGNGEPVHLGPRTIRALLNNNEFKNHFKRIVSGVTPLAKGNFPINMGLGSYIYIGHTNVNYQITYGETFSTVSFELFVNDGFWDVDVLDEVVLGRWFGVASRKPDAMGGNLERFGGKPYPFIPETVTYFFRNPQ